jgi:hypothetical protein
MWLCTKTTDRFKLVFQGDPAVEGDGDGWIPEDKADIRKGEAADVFVCRPLNADECFRIIQATQKNPSFMAYAAALGVTEIHTGGRVIDSADEIEEILENAQNMGPIMALASTIFQVSREGLDVLPFRSKGDPVE